VTEQNATTTPARDTQRSADLSLALLVSLAAAAVLAAVSFWPARTWAPPRRPRLDPPVVFDEFVNAPVAPIASSSSPSPDLN